MLTSIFKRFYVVIRGQESVKKSRTRGWYPSRYSMMLTKIFRSRKVGNWLAFWSREFWAILEFHFCFIVIAINLFLKCLDFIVKSRCSIFQAGDFWGFKNFKFKDFSDYNEYVKTMSNWQMPISYSSISFLALALLSAFNHILLILGYMKVFRKEVESYWLELQRILGEWC